MDGDGNATPLDVLRLIDFLNARRAAAAAEGEFDPQPPHPVAADDGSEMLWLGHMDAAVSNSRRSTEGLISASRDAAPEDAVEGLPIEPVWPAQTDRLFGSGDIDWREDSSPTAETVSELNLTRELDAFSHAWA